MSILSETIEYLQGQIDKLDADRDTLASVLNALQARQRQTEMNRVTLPPRRRHPSDKQRLKYPPATADDVLACLADGIHKPGAIAAKLGTHHMSVVATLKALDKANLAKMVEPGRWQAVSEQNWTEYRSNELNSNTEVSNA